MGSQTSTVYCCWRESLELAEDASLARIQDYLDLYRIVNQKPNLKSERELERSLGTEMLGLSIFL